MFLPTWKTILVDYYHLTLAHRVNTKVLYLDPRDIPIEQTAGLTPLQIQARQQAGRMGEYQPYLTEAGRLFGRQERGLDEAFGYLPGAREAVTGGLGALQRAEETAKMGNYRNL